MQVEMQQASVSTPSAREIRIERIFNASRERVWLAMTDPDLVAQWWGRGNKLVVERMEVHPGGHWRFVEHNPDGVYGFEGRYREVTPPEERDGMLSAGMEEGLNQSYAALDRLLASIS